MKRWIRFPLQLFGWMFLSLAGCHVVVAQNTYYVSSSTGSDSNTAAQAQNKATPWAHLPGMVGATGSAASYAPVPGDSFVLRGCDTWTASGSVFVTVSQSGSSGNQINYGGLDKNWYNTTACPNGWNRPVFGGGGTWPGTTANGKFFAVPASHITIQWIEFAATYVSGSGYVVMIDPNVSSDLQISNCYAHNFNYLVGSLTGGASSFFAYSNNSGSGGGAFLNYVDFSDSPADAQSVFSGFTFKNAALYENYMSNMDTCAVGNFTVVHDNWFNKCAVPAVENGLHANNFESNGDMPGGSLYYNNLTTHVQGNSPINFQVGPPSGATSYVFNNVFADMVPGSVAISCSNGINPTSGTCMEFNNTIECGPDSDPASACTQNGDKGPPSPTVDFDYNHLITSAGSILRLLNGSGISSTGNVSQSLSTANGQGYTFSNLFAPTSSGDATVGAGHDLSSTCSTIGSNFGSQYQTACMHDTTQGVSINTSNHTIEYPARTPLQRPTGSNWDAGAYQFQPGSATQPLQPPTNLGAVVTQ